MRDVSSAGMFSVMHTIKPMPFAAASYTASGAKGAGTYTMEVFAPVASTASRTVSNTGTPATVFPPLPGVTPATTFVPYSTICSVWNAPSRPVIP